MDLQQTWTKYSTTYIEITDSINNMKGPLKYRNKIPKFIRILVPLNTKF